MRKITGKHHRFLMRFYVARLGVPIGMALILMMALEQGLQWERIVALVFIWRSVSVIWIAVILSYAVGMTLCLLGFYDGYD